MNSRSIRKPNFLFKLSRINERVTLRLLHVLVETELDQTEQKYEPEEYRRRQRIEKAQCKSIVGPHHHSATAGCFVQ